MKVDLEELLWMTLRIVWLSAFILLGVLACDVLAYAMLNMRAVLQ